MFSLGHFPSFRIGGFLLSLLLTYIFFLGRVDDSVSVCHPADRIRSVPGLVSVIGLLICGSGHALWVSVRVY